ncbi:MAG: gliding motility-associated C-terminal domain-containing protein [Crocinitomicaceae bacterium]|nr:gliding motility-associated C-terminal domain-containing protein [Crocinitomicaceae bacterium]
MRLSIQIIFVFLTISFMNYGQSLDWLVSAGGALSDKGSTIAVDSDGNTFITGYYNEQAQFGPFDTGFSFSHSKEVFVAKLDPDGNFLWVTNGLNYYDDRGLGLCLDPQGNAYVTGTCWGGLDWPPFNVYNPTSYTDQIFVTKIDTDGNVIWMKNAGVDQTGFLYSDDHGHAIESDSQGNIFVTGHIANNDYDPQSAHFGAIDIPLNSGDTLGFLAKLSNDGVWQWVQTFGGVNWYRDNDIAVDDEDNVYVAGGFVGTRTFGTDVITSVNNSSDIYVVKYDNDGVYQYVLQVGDSLTDRADGITYGNDGHMYVTGEFEDEVFFGTDDLNNYGGPVDKDIFVAKMTKDGVWVWATKAGSKKGSDRGIGICSNDQGDIFVSGQYKDTAKFGAIEVYAGLDSIQFFVGKISSDGIWQWVLDGGGPWKDRANFVAADDQCNVYFVGFYKDQLDAAGLSIVSAGLNDIFIGKISDACNIVGPPTPEEPEEPPCDPNVSDCVTGVHVPTGFSPNGSGANETFSIIVGIDVTSIVFSIYDRWGNQMFQSTETNFEWDGTYHGQPCNVGVYAYMVEIVYNDGTAEVKSGNITLVK